MALRDNEDEETAYSGVLRTKKFKTIKATRRKAFVNMTVKAEKQAAKTESLFQRWEGLISSTK